MLERSIPLPDVAGRIDHLALDSKHARLFVAELGNGSLDVVDLKAGRVAQRISGLQAPQGVAYVADQNLIAVTSAGDGTVRFYDGASFAARSILALGDDADNIRIDPATGNLLVGYGAGALAVIDPKSEAKRGDIGLPGHPESFQIDAHTRRAFVNVPDVGVVVAVDLAQERQVSLWKTESLGGNFPMAFDAAAAELAVVFRDPPSLAFIDPASGAITDKLQSCGDADDLFIDSRRQRIYVSCGEGVIDVFGREGKGYRHVDTIPTREGARTSLYDPMLDRLYVAARAEGNQPAAILVFEPKR